MLSGMVLILCVEVGTPSATAFAKLVGYQAGMRNIRDFINSPLPSDDVECKRVK